MSLALLLSIINIVVVTSPTSASDLRRPSAPTHLVARAGYMSATVSFSPPASMGGSKVFVYVIKIFPQGKIITCTYTKCLIHGLSNSITYYFAVLAENQMGPGPYSKLTNKVTPYGSNAKLPTLGPAVTPTLDPTPSASDTPTPIPTPLDTVATAPALSCSVESTPTSYTPSWSQPSSVQLSTQWISSSSISATWCPALAIDGGPIIYTVTSDPGGFTCTTVETTCVIMGLPSRSYNIELMATNKNGSSPSDPPVVGSGAIYPCNTDRLTCFHEPSNLVFSDYGNVAPTNLGDCTFAAVAYWQQIVLNKIMNQTQLGFEFSQAGGSLQFGLSDVQLFTYWLKSGINGIYLKSVQRYYFDQIDVQNAVMDYTALIAFLHFKKGATIGPYQQMTSGNHLVVVDGFTPQGPLVVTWGQTLQMTWQQWNMEVTDMFGITTVN